MSSVEDSSLFKRPLKAYHNREFLESTDARPVRILSEFEEPSNRFRRLRINNTVVFFGSSRTLSGSDSKKRLQAARSALRSSPKDSRLRAEVEAAEHGMNLSRYYDDARALAEKLTDWSVNTLRPGKRFYVCSGGGPGIMEAANRGARDAKGRSIGLNISLPFEQDPNPFQSSELAFEFHYFFMRKFWFVYHAKALVVFPGGFGTMDEMFELLTLVQTEKTTKKMPILLYGAEYWNDVINFDALIKWGTISREDLKLFRFSDSVADAFRYLKKELTRLHLE